jgi:putative inorganic carbon (hco3(-)) transporter
VYPQTALPVLAACAGAFLLTRARIAAHPQARVLDAALLLSLAAILFQTVPLPGFIAATLSPEAWSMQAMLHFDRVRAWWPLSIDSRLTRLALTHAAAPVLLFWAAREAFGRGGVRTAARAIAWTGFALTIVALAQRATAPLTLMWYWRPPDAGSQPLGPFVNPNHFAAWLVMAAALTAGYLVAHRRTHRTGHPSVRLLLRDWLADGSGLILAGSLVIMLLGLAASLSRAAIVSAAAALVLTLAVVQRHARTGQGVRAGAAIVAMVLAGAVWANRAGLERKFADVTAVSRVTIWRDTVPVIADFWVTGTGAGTYSRAMLRYQHASPEFHFNQAHSEPMQLAAEGGLLLAVPVIFVAIAWLALARRQLQRDVHEVFWIRVGAAAGLLAVAVQGIFDTPLRVPANALLAALLAAIVVHDRRGSGVRDPRARTADSDQRL